MNISTEHINPLTSIRFFAAFFVFLCHLRYFLGTELSFVYIKEGFIGVTFFFVLSGFILTHSYQERMASGKINLRDFYIARIARVYPVHLFTFLIAIVFFSFNYYSIKQFLFNLLLIHAHIPEQKFYFTVNAVSWSLSVEIFLYLLFPLLIKLSNKKIILISIVLIIVKLIFSHLLSGKLNHAMIYISPLFRIPDFTIGIIAYRYRSVISNHLKVVSLLIFQLLSVLSFVVLCYYSERINITYRYDIYYIIPMALVILSLSISGTFLYQILSNRLLVFLGECSFSFYMIHQLVIMVFIENKEKLELNDVQLLFVIFTSAMVLSMLTYKFIEIPSKRILTRILKSISFNYFNVVRRVK